MRDALSSCVGEVWITVWTFSDAVASCTEFRAISSLAFCSAPFFTLELLVTVSEEFFLPFEFGASLSVFAGISSPSSLGFLRSYFFGTACAYEGASTCAASNAASCVTFSSM
ncbi:MAG: hypothetical protein HDR36_09895 [Treponema sp.]|nr:hypothetical protein [Treponema sp.]